MEKIIHNEKEKTSKLQQFFNNRNVDLKNFVNDIKTPYNKEIITTHKQMIALAKKTYPYIWNNFSESLYIFLLNDENLYTNYLKVNWSINQASINYNFLFSAMQETNTQKVIAIHNHPSNIPIPSDKDDKFTNKLFRKLHNKWNILIDHLIFTKLWVYSFKEDGKL